MLADPPPPKDPISARRELAIRAVVGVALIAAAVIAELLGGFALWLLVTLMALGIMHEWAQLTGRTKNRKLAMYALTIPLAIMCPWAAGPSFLALGLIFGAAMFMMAIDQSSKLGIGILYAGLPALAILYLRETDNGMLRVFWALALVWATDIGAYFSGRAIGGPKLWPKYSPKKTWAGLIGGCLAAFAFSTILHIYADLDSLFVLLSVPLAVLAQAGDLFESRLKRNAGVKDSGRIFPGHGGVMDRLDGLMPVAPAVALVVLANAV